MLARGQVERQPVEQSGPQSVVARRRLRSGLGQLTVPAPGQRPLHADGLVEGEPAARPIPIGFLLGDVDVAQCGVLGDQIMFGEKGIRQRVGDRVEHGQHLPDTGIDVPALQFRAGRIDREEVAFEHRHVELAVAGLRGRGDGAQRLGATDATRRRIEDEVTRMGQLHGALVVADLTGEHQPGSGHELLLEVLGVEEGGRHLGAAVAQRDDEVLPLRRAVGPAHLGLLDLADEGDVLALLGQFVVLASHCHALAVLAGIVPQQVAHGVDAEDILKGASGFRAQHAVEPVGQRRHHSTPISRTSPR